MARPGVSGCRARSWRTKYTSVAKTGSARTDAVQEGVGRGGGERGRHGTGPIAAACRRLGSERGSLPARCCEEGSLMRTDDWSNYPQLQMLGYRHDRALTAGAPDRLKRELASPPSGRPPQAVTAGDAPVRGGAPSERLARRLHLPVRPHHISSPRPAVLPVATAGRSLATRRSETRQFNQLCGKFPWSEVSMEGRNMLWYAEQKHIAQQERIEESWRQASVLSLC